MPTVQPSAANTVAVPWHHSGYEAAKDIAAGTAGGVATVVVGHPLDTVKVRMQTGEYSSMLACIRSTLSREGMRGFYKGAQSPLVGEGVFNAIQFFAYGQSKHLLLSAKPAPAPLASAPELSVSDYFIAGGLTGGASVVVECPIDLVKSQLQTAIFAKSPPPYRTFSECVRYIYGARGVSGFYQGLTPTILRTVPSTAAYFGCYEWTRGLLLPRGADRSADLRPEHILIAGGVGGVMYWLSTFPVDSIKSAMQSDAIIPNRRRYASMSDAVRQLYADGGIARFYRGVVPCVLRAFPANSACFLVYEYAHSALDAIA